MAERPCWEAQIDLTPVARAPFPKVVVTGEWDRAHPAYRAATGDALVACGSFVAERIGARLIQVPGADHFPHRDRSDVVNALLREVWNAAAGHDRRGGADGTGDPAALRRT
jgi:pimeloyl-ACP methyl ester carboxylesterase